MSATWKCVYWDGAVDPETGGECQIDVLVEGGTHEGPHCTTEWRDGEIVGPVYWGDLS